MEQGHNVGPGVQCGGIADFPDLPPDKAGIVLPLHRILIGLLVQDLLHLPQVPGGGDGVAEQPARAEDPGELVDSQGGEDVRQYIGTAAGQRQAVDRRHGELSLRDPLRRPAQSGLGQVHPGDSGAGQGLGQSGGVIALAAPAVQNDGGGEGGRILRHCLTQGLPQGLIVPLFQKGGPGGYHGLVVPRVLGVLLIGGEEVDITGGGPVEAVARRAGPAICLPLQRGRAQGTAEQAFQSITSFSPSYPGGRKKAREFWKKGSKFCRRYVIL